MNDALEPQGPEREPDVDAAADEHLIHGLLESLRQDDSRTRMRRVERVMQAIADERRGVTASELSPRKRRVRVGTLLPLVAATLAVSLSVLFWPRGESVASLVEDSLEASSSVHRRYRVEATLAVDESQPFLTGTIDVRDDRHYLFRASHVDGKTVAAGHNDRGPWLLHHDGRIEWVKEGGAHLQWLAVHDSAVIAETIDSLARHLRHDYALEKHGAPIDGIPHDHIIAQRHHEAGSHPGQVELWIDHHSRLMKRMELHWLIHHHRKHRHSAPGHHGSHHTHGHDHLHGHHHIPQFLHEDPGFDNGDHTAPQKMTIELIETPVFEDGWFDPERHRQ